MKNTLQKQKSITKTGLQIFCGLCLIFYPSIVQTYELPIVYLSDQNYQDVLVKEVLSADTILLEDGQRIKMIGLEAPEAPPKKRMERDQFGFIVKDPVSPVTSIEERALDFAKELLEGKRVRLEFDYDKRDKKFTIVAYVFLPDETLANAEIIRKGFANLTIRPPNVKYAEELRTAYREARKEKRGLQGE